MEILLMQSKEVTTACGDFQLVYELLMSHFEKEEGSGSFFGIRIQQYRKGRCLVDYSEAVGVTENLDEAKDLFLQLSEEVAMPVHLYEMIDDWQSAFHPRMQEM